MKQVKVVKGGVTSPKGFVAAGIKAGIKKSGRPDLALIYSEVPAVAAGAFTTNVFVASPVKVSKTNLSDATHQAIIVNSGNANCANGRRGDRDAREMTELAAMSLCLKPKGVLVASTGIIGNYLPIDKIRKVVVGLTSALRQKGGSDFASAIMTTDTTRKEAAVSVRIGGAKVTIGGACKGVGMLYPVLKTERHPSTLLRMVPIKAAGGGRVERHATMLCFLTTDAAISKKLLALALDEAIGGTLNAISVDGDMSTNDSCFILANSLAGNRTITAKGMGYRAFADALRALLRDLSKRLVEDGEGATKMIEIKVIGAPSDDAARTVARKISTSNLLKCAIFGEDPNWGRVVAAAGASGIKFNADRIDVYLGSIQAMRAGASIKSFDKERAREIFKRHEVDITVDLKSGHGRATAWTCDFSKEYVAINSEYST